MDNSLESVKQKLEQLGLGGGGGAGGGAGVGGEEKKSEEEKAESEDIVRDDMRPAQMSLSLKVLEA